MRRRGKTTSGAGNFSGGGGKLRGSLTPPHTSDASPPPPPQIFNQFTWKLKSFVLRLKCQNVVIIFRASSFELNGLKTFLFWNNWKIALWKLPKRFQSAAVVLSEQLLYLHELNSRQVVVYFSARVAKPWKTCPGHTSVQSGINYLHPNISMHILHTVRYAPWMVLTRRIWSVKSFRSLRSFPLFFWP